MDIANFIPTTDTVEVELKSPVTGDVLTNSDESPMTVTMYLPHSKQYKEVRHAQTNKRIQESQKKSKKTITAEEIEAETIDLLVKTTVGWNITYNDEMPQFSTELAKEVYEKASWIADQLYEGVGDAEVFTKN